MIKTNTIFFVSLALLTLFTGCLDKNFIDFDEQLRIDGNIIDEYLRDNNITAIKHPSGLRYVINAQGTGAQPNDSSTVSVTYTGKLLSNGQIFDATQSPISFGLTQLITSWKIGIPLINVGGEITLYAPSGLCYGTNPPQGSIIRSNSILIFNIDLISVTQ